MITRRVPIAAAALLLLVAGGFYVAAKPYLPKRPRDGIRMPAHRASNAHWIWPDGVPGWKPGERYKGIPVANVLPVEVQAAQLAAARAILDPDQVRVLASFRPGYRGVYAILAAPTREATPQRTCLAALRLDEPVAWTCPTTRRIYAVVARTQQTLIVVGVARGDVSRVVFHGEDLLSPKTWGEFSGGWATSYVKSGTLVLYGRGRVLERIPVDLRAGESTIVG